MIQTTAVILFYFCRIMNFLSIGFILLFLTSCSISDRKQENGPSLRIGFQESPPYQIINSEGEPEGIGIDIIKTAAANIGLKLEWVYSPESPDVHFANDEVDLWPVITDIPYRRKHFYITEPIYQNSVGIISLEKSNIRRFSDLENKRVAYYNREPGITLVRELVPSATYVPMPGNAETIGAVFKDEPIADAAFVWSTKSNSLLFKQEIQQHTDKPFRFHFFEDSKITCGIAASYKTPGAQRTADRLRNEVRRLATNGKVQEVYFKYYLDPENEISSYFFLNNLQRRNFFLTISIICLAFVLTLSIVLTVLLKKSQKRAQAANRSKSRFVANMSHEIRTPLNGVLNMTELALTTKLTPSQQELISIAHESADSLLQIVNDVLDISKIEAGKLEISMLPFSLREVIDSCVIFFDPQAKEKEISLEIDYAEDCPNYIMGDASRLKQILFNLVGNAIKYTESGSVQIITKKIMHSKGDELVFEIADTGIGISAEQRNTIFDSFTQADDSSARKFGGTGLGLSICRQLILMMNGSIELISELGKGSTFRIRLPLHEAPNPDQSATTEIRKKEPNLDNEHTKRRALLVDDNPVNLKIGTTVLERYGHEVITVQSGREALEVVKSNTFDLILMDIQMPDLDGYETTRKIRKWEQDNNSYTPIIALTACVLNDEETRCRSAGMDAYLSKPLRVNVLLTKISDVTKVSGRR